MGLQFGPCAHFQCRPFVKSQRIKWNFFNVFPSCGPPTLAHRFLRAQGLHHHDNSAGNLPCSRRIELGRLDTGICLSAGLPVDNWPVNKISMFCPGASVGDSFIILWAYRKWLPGHNAGTMRRARRARGPGGIRLTPWSEAAPGLFLRYFPTVDLPSLAFNARRTRSS